MTYKMFKVFDSNDMSRELAIEYVNYVKDYSHNDYDEWWIGQSVVPAIDDWLKANGAVAGEYVLIKR